MPLSLIEIKVKNFNAQNLTFCQKSLMLQIAPTFIFSKGAIFTYSYFFQNCLFWDTLRKENQSISRFHFNLDKQGLIFDIILRAKSFQ